MELLTRNNFESWMRKLMERLDRQDELLLSLQPSGKAPNPMESSAFTALTEQIAEIAAHVRAVSGERKEKSADRLLTTREAAHLLNVSTRTLQRMRNEHRIGYVVLRGKCRYRQSEIDRLLADCTVMEDAATPTELKRNHTLRTGGSKPKGRRT